METRPAQEVPASTTAGRSSLGLAAPSRVGPTISLDIPVDRSASETRQDGVLEAIIRADE